MSTSTAPIRWRIFRHFNRRRLVAFVLVVLPVGLVCFGYLPSRLVGDMRLDQAIAEADRLDPGWRFDDLEASRQPFPELAKNGIDQVLRVKAAMPKGMWPEWPFPKFQDDKPYLLELRRAMDESLQEERPAYTLLNAEQERVYRAEVARAHEAIELARQMPQYPSGRFAVKWLPDFISTLQGHAQETRHIGYLMSIDGRLRAHDGDLDGALQNIKATLYASRAIGDEPMFISQLVRTAGDSGAVHYLERVLSCGQASEPALFDLQKELELQAQTPYFLTGIRGQRAGLDFMMQNVENGQLSSAQFRQTLEFLAGLSFDALRQRPDDWRVEIDFQRVYLNIRAERAHLLHFMNQLVELAKQPTWQGVYAIESAMKEERNNTPFWADHMCNLDRVALVSARTGACLRAACTAVAAERFRLAKGRWPTTLAELVPHFLDEVPRDPFDGQPLRYVRKSEGPVIYSVSYDREDQGGAVLDNWLDKGSDLPFFLLDVSQRRRPAKPFVLPPREAAENGPDDHN